jgi:hypothetical protein
MTATPTPAADRSKSGLRKESGKRLDATIAKANELAAPKSLRLPDALRSYHDELLKACATPFPPVWDDDATYVKAEQPAAIAKVLTRALHIELQNAQLAVVFRKAIKTHDKSIGAKASKIGGKLNYFTELDLLIEVNHEVWQNMTAERRIALIDHELTHFARAESGTGGSYEMVEHDIEEFGSIVRRWGFWSTDVERFASSIEKARQLDIFSAPIEKASTPSTVN